MRKFEFVERLKASLSGDPPVPCPRCLPERLLGVAQTRTVLTAALANTALQQQIVAIHAASRATYGAPRIHAELARAGGALLPQAGGAPDARGGGGRLSPSRVPRPRTRARSRRVRARRTCCSERLSPPLPIRCGSPTSRMCPPSQGFLFLAIVLDACSRRIVGWSMAAHLRAELVLAALDMALQHRRPAAGVIHHSDHGSQYTAHAFQERCRQAGIRSSMGSVGDCYDNAMAESFFATLECELLSRSSFPTHAEARSALFDFIEVFYNRQRRHSALGSLSPEGFERRITETPVVA